MLQSAVRSDQRIAIYWPKSDLLLLFIIIVKAGVIPTKTDWNAMNLTRQYRERKKERKVTEEEKEERTNPKFCQWCQSFICRFKLEIVLSWLPCRHPYNHFTLGRLNQNWQNRTESVCAEPLFVIPACEPKICTKNSSIGWDRRPRGLCGWVNDLSEKLMALLRLFADDTAVYRVVYSGTDQVQLQQDLHCLMEWEESWDMLFHPAKCVSLPITKSRSPLCSYELHGHTLDSVSSAKYLGITIQQDMDWDNHINNMANKANRTLGFLQRSLKISSSTIKDRAYKAFVRPILEYTSSVWDPYTQKSIDKLEAIQRQAAQFVLNQYHNTCSVHLLLDSLRGLSLEQCRRTSHLGVRYKICSGLVQCPIIKTKLVPPPPCQRCTHCQQLSLITTRMQYCGGSFLPCTIRDWNSLSIDAVEAMSVDNFVSRASHWPDN